MGRRVAMIDDLTAVRRALLRWHRANGLRAPWRESADPYHVFVAAVMAQQTQMSRVMECYARFLAVFPTVEALAAASRADVIRTWAGMGYNQRAVRLHEAARAVAATGWPREADDLAKISGIGPFTAAIIASFAFARPAACVDTNVRRVLGRLAGDEALRPAAIQSLADVAMARRAPARWNQALMDYGARVCTPRPKCGECVVAASCRARDRYASPRVGERRGGYRAARPETPYEGSPRFWRGRIVDALRSLGPAEGIAVRALSTLIADGRPAPSLADTRALLAALERDGLAVVRRGRVTLPE
jgi:A/G-specific adenine glycosylase